MENQLFNTGFIQEMMQSFALNDKIEVLDVKRFEIDNSASILSVLTSGTTELKIGHYGLEITYLKNDQKYHEKAVLKVKPHGELITNMINQLALANAEPLASIYPQFSNDTGFYWTHERELAIYEQLNSPLFPKIYGTKRLEKEGLYLVLMECLTDKPLLNSVMQIDLWTDRHIKVALDDLVKWHSQILSNPPKLKWQDSPNKAQKLRLTPLWNALLDNASEKFPHVYTPTLNKELQVAINQILKYWTALEQMPQSLVHNDCNPRNACFREAGNQLSFCLYDWELSNWHVPHYDVVELLSFVIDPKNELDYHQYLTYFYDLLAANNAVYQDKHLSRQAFLYAAYDFGIHRLGMYMMAHAVSPYPFLERVVNSYCQLLVAIKSWK